MYDTILIPTDGSTVATNAVDHALEVASRFDADIHVLYVIDTAAMDITFGTEQVERLKQGRFDEMPEIRDRAETATESASDRANERGIETTEAIVAGQPHRQIASYADANDIDLIVMGSAGRGGVKRALLGSVAERTLRTTDRPVLVVDARE